MEHKPGYIVLVVLTVIVFSGMLFFNALASGALGKNDIFHNKTGEISDVFYIEITPAGWTFSIWGLIYLWQALWLIYSLTTLCRSSSYGYLYVSPAHIPPIVYILYIINNVCNVSWLILWDRLYPQYALIPMVMLPISLYAIMYFLCYQLHASAAILKREGKVGDIWSTRIFVQNGIALYAAWVTIATLLNLAVVLTYQGGMDQKLASTISLALLLVLILIWFFMETTLLDQYLRYVLSPFIAIIMGLVGSLVKNWDPDSTNSILTAFTLALVCVLAIIRVILMVIRHWRQPQYNTEPSFYSSQGDYGSLARSFEKAAALS